MSEAHQQAVEAIQTRPIRANVDGLLEATDLTIAELQQLLVQSRLLKEDFGYAELVTAICENLRRMCEHRSPDYAIAVAALALRIREEHL